MKPTEPEGRRWRSYAFGIEIDSGFQLPGFVDAAPAGHPVVKLDLTSRAEVVGVLNAPQVTHTVKRDDGRWVVRVLAEPGTGHVIQAVRLGSFYIADSANQIMCAPTRIAEWLWHKYVVGQVLPFASALHGFDTWHSGAVSVDDRAIALVADSGVGKSSLACHLHLLGAKFVSDDVIALEASDSNERVIVHPGAGLASLRRPTLDQMTTDEIARLGTVVGADDWLTRFAMVREDRALPLDLVYLLQRDRTVASVELTEITRPDPRLLLANTFNRVLTGPEQLLNHLDVCAAMARSARVVRVAIPWAPSADNEHRSPPYGSIAARLWEDAQR